MVDLGGDRSRVGVYKKNMVGDVGVIGLGSKKMRKDICRLEMEEEDGEELKIG